MKSDRKIDEETVAAMSRYVDLPLADDRIKELTPFLQNVFGLLEHLDACELGEITPAFSFKAKWG
jgi:hypothetical protein